MKWPLVVTVVLVLGPLAAAQQEMLSAREYREQRLDKLIERLDSGNARVRGLATEHIIALQDLAAARLLKELPATKNDFVRDQIIVILNRMNVKDAVPLYLDLLEPALRRQAEARRKIDEVNERKQKLGQLIRERGLPRGHPVYKMLEDLDAELPRKFSGTDFEVEQLARGISQMGHEGHLDRLTDILLESRKDSTVHADQWHPAWRPVWEALERLIENTYDPERLRRCVTKLRREADPLARKNTRTPAEAHFLGSFQVVDLLVDARLDKLLYQ